MKPGNDDSPRSRRVRQAAEPEVAAYDERAAEFDDLREAVDALTEVNGELAAENAKLRDAVAVGRLPAGERFDVERILAELRAEVAGLLSKAATLTATLRAVEATRDRLMDENGQLKRQVAMQRREIERLGGGRHAAA